MHRYPSLCSVELNDRFKLHFLFRYLQVDHFRYWLSHRAEDIAFCLQGAASRFTRRYRCWWMGNSHYDHEAGYVNERQNLLLQGENMESWLNL